MLAQVKKLAGGDVAGRFGAWWNGREYVPAEAGAEGDAPAAADAAKDSAKAVAKPAAETPKKEPAPEAIPEPKPEAKIAALPKPEEAKPVSTRAAADGGAVRLSALETLWGEGRFAPGSFSIDTRLLDAALELADRPGDIGFIGADGALAADVRRSVRSQADCRRMARGVREAPRRVCAEGVRHARRSRSPAQLPRRRAAVGGERRGVCVFRSQGRTRRPHLPRARCGRPLGVPRHDAPHEEDTAASVRLSLGRAAAGDE